MFANDDKRQQLLDESSVDYKSLNNGCVRIPDRMRRILKWTHDKPIRIELMNDGTVRLTQVEPDEYGLQRGNMGGWQVKARRDSRESP
jgi:hypothetical protein